MHSCFVRKHFAAEPSRAVESEINGKESLPELTKHRDFYPSEHGRIQRDIFEFIKRYARFEGFTTNSACEDTVKNVIYHPFLLSYPDAKSSSFFWFLIGFYRFLQFFFNLKHPCKYNHMTSVNKAELNRIDIDLGIWQRHIFRGYLTTTLHRQGHE